MQKQDHEGMQHQKQHDAVPGTFQFDVDITDMMVTGARLGRSKLCLHKSVCCIAHALFIVLVT